MLIASRPSSTRRGLLALTAAMMLACAGAGDAKAQSCDNYLGFTTQNHSWIDEPPYLYRIIRSSIDTQFKKGTHSYTARRVIARIRAGVRAWNNGVNDCEKPKFTNFKTLWEDMTGEPNGTTTALNQNDHVSAVDFGHIPRCPGVEEEDINSLVGCAYVESNDDRVETKAGKKRRPVTADVRFADDVKWYIGTGKTADKICPSGKPIHYDLWSVSSHEFGHVAGLGHIDKDFGNQQIYNTMYPNADDCDSRRRTLALGDYRGLVKLYTPGD